jgi:hypothetical protein
MGAYSLQRTHSAVAALIPFCQPFGRMPSASSADASASSFPKSSPEKPPVAVLAITHTSSPHEDRLQADAPPGAKTDNDFSISMTAGRVVVSFP